MFIKKIIRFSSTMYKMRIIVPNKILCKLYYAFVHPYITYGLEIYANASKTALDKLIKANNKILRILLNKTFDTSNLDLYRTFNVLHIPLLHELSLLELMFKLDYCNKSLPGVFPRYYVVNSSIHNHLTRSTLNL